LQLSSPVGDVKVGLPGFPGIVDSSCCLVTKPQFDQDFWEQHCLRILSPKLNRLATLFDTRSKTQRPWTAPTLLPPSPPNPVAPRVTVRRSEPTACCGRVTAMRATLLGRLGVLHSRSHSRKAAQPRRSGQPRMPADRGRAARRAQSATEANGSEPLSRDVRGR